MTDKIVLDNSARSTFRTCQRKYFYQNIKGLQPDFGSTALRFGSAYHAMQEGYHAWVKENELLKVQNKAEASLIYSELNILNKAMTLASFELMGDANLINIETELYQKYSQIQLNL